MPSANTKGTIYAIILIVIVAVFALGAGVAIKYATYKSQERGEVANKTETSFPNEASEPIVKDSPEKQPKLITNESPDAQRLRDILFIQNKLEEYAEKSNFYPGVTQRYYDAYKTHALELYYNSPELQEMGYELEYELFIESLLKGPPEQILEVNLEDSGIITEALPRDPETGAPYTYRFSLENNNYLVDTYLLSAILGASNDALENDVDGLVLGIDCNDPVYCVKRTNELVSRAGRDEGRIEAFAGFAQTVNYYLSVADNPIICHDGSRVYSSDAGSTAIDGTGWLPIDWTKTPGGSFYDELPVDPINAGEFVYRYKCNPSTMEYEFNTRLESALRQEFSRGDGGNNQNLYEIGTNLHLLP